MLNSKSGKLNDTDFRLIKKSMMANLVIPTLITILGGIVVVLTELPYNDAVIVAIIGIIAKLIGSWMDILRRRKTDYTKPIK